MTAGAPELHGYEHCGRPRPRLLRSGESASALRGLGARGAAQMHGNRTGAAASPTGTLGEAYGGGTTFARTVNRRRG
jgi:hypothetical protein